MSRYQIAARDDERFKIVVGWDQPLQTFFGQVIDRAADAADDDESRIVLWIGASLREIDEIDDLARDLRDYANLGPNVRQRLYDDKDEGR